MVCFVSCLGVNPDDLRSGAAPEFDVCDAATWSSIAVLSEKSVADRSRPVNFRDFTKGNWKTTPPIKIMGVWVPSHPGSNENVD